MDVPLVSIARVVKAIDVTEKSVRRVAQAIGRCARITLENGNFEKTEEWKALRRDMFAYDLLAKHLQTVMVIICKESASPVTRVHIMNMMSFIRANLTNLPYCHALSRAAYLSVHREDYATKPAPEPSARDEDSTQLSHDYTSEVSAQPSLADHRAIFTSDQVEA